MDLRQLAAIVAVADHGSFSAAARALHTVQSNISTHIAHLERELGVTVVDRSTGQLTEEGTALVSRARRIHSELDALVADVAAVHSEVAGTVHVGLIGTTARWLLAPLLESMAQGYPGVHLVVIDATTTSLLPQLHNGQLDLAVLALPIHDPDIETELLFEEDLILIAPNDHPLARFDRVTVTDLAEHELLLGPPGTAFRDDLDTQAAAAGVKLNTRAEVDGMRLVASLAFEGFGAAVLPASAQRRMVPGGFKVVPIEGLTGREVGLARRKRGMLSAPARALGDVIRRVVIAEATAQDGVHPAIAV